MSDRSEPERSQIEALLQQGKYEEALAVIQRLLQKGPLDRELRLYRLLVDTMLGKPESYEDEVDAIRSLPDLSANERAIARRIFGLGLQAAQREGRSEAAEAYQTLLSSLELSQPLTQSIPKAPAHSCVVHDSAYMLAFGASERRFFKKRPLARKVVWILIAVVVLIIIALAYKYFSGDGPTENRGAADTTKQDGQVDTQDPILVADGAGLQTSGIKTQTVRAMSEEKSAPKKHELAAVKSTSIAQEENTAGVSPKKSSADIEPKDPAQSSSAKDAEPENEFRGVYRMRGPIPIREEPAFSSAIAQETRRGSRIDVLELRGDWRKVRTYDGGIIGFVRKEFILPVEPGKR